MKQQRIPEHQLNVTLTVGQAIENMSNNEKTSQEVPEKIQSSTIHANEAK